MPNPSDPHGFVWPAGLPDCTQCGRPAASGIHVNPVGVRTGLQIPLRMSAADRSTPNLPDRAHAYAATSTTLLNNVRCQRCGKPMGQGNHPMGMPGSYGGDASTPAPLSPDLRMTVETAFVSEIGGKVVLAGKAHAGTTRPEGFAEKAGTRTANLWIAGRYVQADRPNRNAAYWSSQDLELGQPSVTHGPLNWLHEEHHVIGTLADSHLVVPTAQTAGEDDLGTHIETLAAVWPWLYPNEARVIAAASDQNKLYFSMECVSRAVACLDDGCGTEMSYRDYMLQKASRCDHMKSGRPRRFVDPMFEGAGIIVPPVQPGWGKANAKVLMDRAEPLVEKQAAAFTGLTDEEATTLVATLLGDADRQPA